MKINCLKIASVILLVAIISGCSKNDGIAPEADFQFYIDDLTVQFTCDVENAKSYSWDFGDGSGSSDQNPVHTYANAGGYKVTLKVSGSDGSNSSFRIVMMDEPVGHLLSGGPDNTEGKTWVLSAAVAGKDGLGGVSNALPLDIPMSDGEEFLTMIGLGQAYADKYTFYSDGSYKVDNSDTYGGSLVSMLYAYVSGQFNLSPITEEGHVIGISGAPDLAPFMDLVYSPNANATWSINKESFAVDAINPNDGSYYSETFEDKQQLVLTEYLGFKDYSILVILKEVTQTKMHVAIGLHGAEFDPTKPTHLVHLSFVAQ